MYYRLILQLFLAFSLSVSPVAKAATAYPSLASATNIGFDPMKPQDEKLQLLDSINRDFNIRFSYRRDRGDRWLNREEFYALGGGDCEDFALAKYHTYLEAGLSRGEFVFIYARQKASGEYHIALIHLPSGKLLDSLTTDTRPILHRDDLEEIFRFDGTHFYPGQIKHLSRGQLRSLQQWQALIRKVEDTAIATSGPWEQ